MLDHLKRLNIFYVQQQRVVVIVSVERYCLFMIFVFDFLQKSYSNKAHLQLFLMMLMLNYTFLLYIRLYCIIGLISALILKKWNSNMSEGFIIALAHSFLSIMTNKEYNLTYLHTTTSIQLQSMQGSPKSNKADKIVVFVRGLEKLQQALLSQRKQKSKSGPIQPKQNEQQNQSLTTFYQVNKLSYKMSFLHKQQFLKLHGDINFSEFVKQFKSGYVTLPSEVLGKRSSKIIMSKTRKYCLKQIEQADLGQIANMLPSFLQYVPVPHKQSATDCHESNCCLTAIYGLFKIEYQIKGTILHYRYVLMPNIRSQFDNVIKVFDIKGHLDGREIDQQDCIDFKFGKDVNFVQSKELVMLRKQMNFESRKFMVQTVRRSVLYLADQDVIDYSLLVSIQNNVAHCATKNSQISQSQQQFVQADLPYKYLKFGQNEKYLIKWGIIDYFQTYNNKKKLENKFKSLFRKTISSVQPAVYSTRLLQFLQKCLLK